MQIIQREVPSTDGIHTLKGTVYIPDSDIKGVLQISHGMVEHIGRYDDFMKYICENGYVVCGHDHLGHGKTAKDESELGYFAEKDGWRIVVNDIHAFGQSVKKEYPGKPFILMGHSMGSFLARMTAVMYPDHMDALIIMGTGGKNPASTPGLMVTDVLKKLYGDTHKSKLTETLAFSSFNNKTEKDNPANWLTHDREKLREHDADPLCLFQFTVSAMHDLIAVQAAANSRDWYEKLRRNLPILLVSGAEDPVGRYGKGVEEVYEKLLSAGIVDVKRILYPHMRHEVLNEIGRENVYADILDFLNLQIS